MISWRPPCTFAPDLLAVARCGHRIRDLGQRNVSVGFPSFFRNFSFKLSFSGLLRAVLLIFLRGKCSVPTTGSFEKKRTSCRIFNSQELRIAYRCLCPFRHFGEQGYESFENAQETFLSNQKRKSDGYKKMR